MSPFVVGEAAVLSAFLTSPEPAPPSFFFGQSDWLNVARGPTQAPPANLVGSHVAATLTTPPD